MASTRIYSIVENLGGAALVAFHLLTPFLRSYRTSWGTVDVEIERSLPGDTLVTHPKWKYTHAVTVHAPVKEVWKWLVQIGAGRGGLYSYEGLENLAGCQIHNAERIIPELQNLKPGDEIRLHPKAPGMHVEMVEHEQYILIHNDNRQSESPSFIHTTWLLYVENVGRDTTRIISRGRHDYSPEFANRLWMGPLLIEPIGFVMERKMLLEMRKRAEIHWAALPAWAH